MNPPSLLRRQIPLFVTYGDIFPRPGEVFPHRERLWRAGQVYRIRESFVVSETVAPCFPRKQGPLFCAIKKP